MTRPEFLIRPGAAPVVGSVGGRAIIAQPGFASSEARDCLRVARFLGLCQEMETDRADFLSVGRRGAKLCVMGMNCSGALAAQNPVPRRLAHL